MSTKRVIREAAAVAPPPLPVEGEAGAEIAALRARVEHLTGEVAALRARLEMLCELEKYRDVVLARHPAVAASAPRARRLEARDFVERADGFHNLEYDDSGLAYRWTGPGHFTRARFVVDRSSPVLVVLRLFSLGRHGAHDRITVDIDGTVYPMRPLGGMELALVAGPVPPRAGGGVTDLFFHVPVTFSPRDAGIDDPRVLGVAVLSIEVTGEG